MPAVLASPRLRRRSARLLAALVAMAVLPFVSEVRTPGRAQALTPASGYWLVASDGGIFAFGDAGFFGSTGSIRLNRPVVTIAPTLTGRGYWLAASDGGIFAFGDAGFFGSTGAIRLNQPIVAMAPTPTGRGYWLAASDGGIFAFGDAGFFGSAARAGAPRSIVAMAPTPTGRGYWQATSSGEVLAFGDATNLGSTGPVNVPIVGMAPTATGGGYWLVGRDGGVFAFGDAGFFGSTGGIRLNQPIVGLAALAPPGARPAPPVTPRDAPGPAPAPDDGPPAPAPSDPPPGSGPEPISPPRESPHGGTSTEDLPRDGTDCGLPERPRRVAQDPEMDGIGEASGMVASQRHPGVYWMIRDSGHTPSVYAVRVDAAGVATSREIPVSGAFNGDWEEVNYTLGPDGRGRLWVVESGQGNQFHQIYEVLEPDPDTSSTAQLLNTYEYAFPDRTYNTEASFMHDGWLVLVTKTTPHARLYRFNSPLTTSKVNVPVYLGELGNSKDVSVVRQSPDRKLLVTASHQAVHLYRSSDGSGSLSSLIGRLPDCELLAFPDANVEAGEFSAAREMVFLDELKIVYQLTLAP